MTAGNYDFAIEQGTSFRRVFGWRQPIVDGQAVVVIIGKDWVSASDTSGNRRLDDHDDFVRLEVEMALARNIRVIPLLVDGASMPKYQSVERVTNTYLFAVYLTQP